MDITGRKITKIAREVSKFTVRTMREDGIGTAEFDVLHVIRKNPGLTQAGVCRVLGTVSTLSYFAKLIFFNHFWTSAALPESP